MHYYQFNIGDYASHTRYLTPLQDLAYRRLLDLYYLHEKPIPEDNPASYIGLNDCSTDVQRVLNDYFILTEKGWINNRADEQIAEYRNKQKSASMAGKKSAEVRKASKDAVLERPLNERTTTVQLTNNHKPITINHKPITTDKTTLSSKQDDKGFETFWEMYPKKVGKKAAQNVWRKIDSPITTLELIRAALSWQQLSDQWTKDNGQYIPNPQTYLNQGRWLDQKTEPTGNQSLSKVGQRAEVAASRWLDRFSNNGESL